jgi:glycolate oxidase iron-sulfur subunit
MAAMPHAAPDPRRLADLAGQCVQCGLCLPSCPTYAIGRQEGASPRGRIALARGLAEGRLAASPALVGHLDGCLACRRCEAVCPANVEYGAQIDGVRALPVMARTRPRWRRLLDRALTGPRSRRLLLALRPLSTLVRPWWRRGRGPWAARLRLLADLPAPPAAAAVAGGGDAPGSADTPAVWLFRGCIADPYEARLRAGARRLLAALGIAAAESPSGLCCGSLAAHGGDAGQAGRQGEALRGWVGTAGVAVVLGSATGCQAQLHDQLAPTGSAVHELHVYLAGLPGLDRLRFAPLPARVAVHRPCSQRQLGAASAAAVLRLLRRVPGLELVDLPELDRCCGAAGSQFLGDPLQAQALRARVLADVAAAAPAIVVSANIGCRLFLDAAGTPPGPRLEVLHPIELLARQLLP